MGGVDLDKVGKEDGFEQLCHLSSFFIAFLDQGQKF